MCGLSISLTKRKFLVYLTLFTLLLSVAGALILHYLEPGHYFGGYPLIPVYFFLYGVFYIYMFDACRRHAPQRMVMLFLGMKMMKFIISMFLLIIYCVAFPDSAVAFMLTFVLFYLGYLIYESWFFFVYEWNKRLKKK